MSAYRERMARSIAAQAGQAAGQAATGQAPAGATPPADPKGFPWGKLALGLGITGSVVALAKALFGQERAPVEIHTGGASVRSGQSVADEQRGRALRLAGNLISKSAEHRENNSDWQDSEEWHDATEHW